MKRNLRLIEWLGAAAGMIGALLIASNTIYSPYGWIAFGVSSVSLVVFAVRLKAWGLLSLQLCFCLTNAIGLWRWLIEPALSAL